jgi:hypothetical protein
MMRYAWEEPADDPWADSSDEEEFDPNTCSQAEAGNLLAEMLINLKLKGILSAKQVCTLAFWAHKAGACGPVEDLKLRPDDESAGRFHRQLDKAVGCNLRSSHEFYEVQIPGASRATSSRESLKIPMLLVHEVLDSEIRELSVERVQELVQQAGAEGRLPQTFQDHVATREAPPGSLVIPVTHYTWTACPSSGTTVPWAYGHIAASSTATIS